MNNNEKIEFIVKLERRSKTKKILIGFLVIAFLGGAMIYSQYKNYGGIDTTTQQK